MHFFFCKPNAGQPPENYSFWFFKSLLMQNAAPRLVTNTNRAHISPILTSLLWVPVQFRIQYKVLLCVLKVFRRPLVYISEVIGFNHNHRPLRSEPTTLLCLILSGHYILHLKLICSLWPLQQHNDCCVLERYNFSFSFFYYYYIYFF